MEEHHIASFHYLALGQRAFSGLFSKLRFQHQTNERAINAPKDNNIGSLVRQASSVDPLDHIVYFLAKSRRICTVPRSVWMLSAYIKDKEWRLDVEKNIFLRTYNNRVEYITILKPGINPFPRESKQWNHEPEVVLVGSSQGRKSSQGGLFRISSIAFSCISTCNLDSHGISIGPFLEQDWNSTLWPDIKDLTEMKLIFEPAR